MMEWADPYTALRGIIAAGCEKTPCDMYPVEMRVPLSLLLAMADRHAQALDRIDKMLRCTRDDAAAEQSEVEAPCPDGAGSRRDPRSEVGGRGAENDSPAIRRVRVLRQSDRAWKASRGDE